MPARPAPQSMLSEAVNQPSFPSEILRPGEEFAQTTVWRFFAQAPTPAAAVDAQLAQSRARAAGLVPAALACILAAAAASLW